MKTKSQFHLNLKQMELFSNLFEDCINIFLIEYEQENLNENKVSIQFHTTKISQYLSIKLNIKRSK